MHAALTCQPTPPPSPTHPPFCSQVGQNTTVDAQGVASQPVANEPPRPLDCEQGWTRMKADFEPLYPDLKTPSGSNLILLRTSKDDTLPSELTAFNEICKCAGLYNDKTRHAMLHKDTKYGYRVLLLVIDGEVRAGALFCMAREAKSKTMLLDLMLLAVKKEYRYVEGEQCGWGYGSTLMAQLNAITLEGAAKEDEKCEMLVRVLNGALPFYQKQGFCQDTDQDYPARTHVIALRKWCTPRHRGPAVPNEGMVMMLWSHAHGSNGGSGIIGDAGGTGSGNVLATIGGSGSGGAGGSDMLATIGDGVAVRESKLGPHAGRGLMADGRSFASGDRITKYEGSRIQSELQLRRQSPRIADGCDPDKYTAASYEVQTHIMARERDALGNRIYIDGDRDEPRDGRGGGSYANHSDDPNAKAVGEGDEIIIVAIEPIRDGDEIYIDYGDGKDVAMGKSRWVQVLDVDKLRNVEKVAVRFSPFETSGVELIENAAVVPPEVMNAIHTSNYGEYGISGDQRRLMTKSSNHEWCKILKEQLTPVLRKHNHLETSDAYEGEKTIHKMNALKSLETEGYDETKTGPQDGDQVEHTDEPIKKLEKMQDEDKPRSMIYSIQLGTRLRIKPLDGDWVIVELKPGDLLVFRGDVCHNGLGYAVIHHRVHAHIDPPGYNTTSALNPCQ